MSVNKVILLGNVGRVDVRDFNGGKVASMSLATTEKGYTRKDGVKVDDKTTWHNVVVFGRLAEVAEQYITKGMKLYVEGKLNVREWTDKEGLKRVTVEVVIDQNGTMEMLSHKAESPAPKPEQKRDDDFGIPF